MADPLRAATGRCGLSRGAPRQPRHRAEPGLRPCRCRQPRLGNHPPPARPEGALGVHAAGHDARFDRRARRAGHRQGAHRRCLDGRHDRAAPRRQCAGAHGQPREHHEFERCARPARSAPRSDAHAHAPAPGQERGRTRGAQHQAVAADPEPGLSADRRRTGRAPYLQHAPRLPSGRPDAADARHRRRRRTPEGAAAHPASDAGAARRSRCPRAHRLRQGFGPRIPGSTFTSVPGMGHDLPPEVCTILANHIAPFAHAADAKDKP
jgi:hypothetical protein